MDLSLSPECRVPGSKLYTLASLRRVKRALREHRTIKVLAIGSSSTLGVGASSPAASYPARLEGELEKLFPGVDVDVVNRGISGEIAAGAADRMRDTVAEVEPDLLVWQVGTNDALARVDLETFSDSLDETLKWLQAHKIDVVLVDPQYTASLAKDDNYAAIVQTIEGLRASTACLSCAATRPCAIWPGRQGAAVLARATNSTSTTSATAAWPSMSRERSPWACSSPNRAVSAGASRRRGRGSGPGAPSRPLEAEITGAASRHPRGPLRLA